MFGGTSDPYNEEDQEKYNIDRLAQPISFIYGEYTGGGGVCINLMTLSKIKSLHRKF